MSLSPFVKDGVLRVGGRTKRSSLPFESKHLTILDAKEVIVKIFSQKCHEFCMHLGVQYTRKYIQQRCHIILVRESLRSLAFRSFDGRRFRAVGLQPAIAELPDIMSHNSSLPAVFTNVGLDYLGPFTVMQRQRSKDIHLSLCMPCLARHSSGNSRRLLNRQMHHINQTIYLKTWPATSFNV